MSMCKPTLGGSHYSQHTCVPSLPGVLVSGAHWLGYCWHVEEASACGMCASVATVWAATLAFTPKWAGCCLCTVAAVTLCTACFCVVKAGIDSSTNCSSLVATSLCMHRTPKQQPRSSSFVQVLLIACH